MRIAKTNYACTCGHSPAEHSGQYGRCTGHSFDSEYGIFLCLCFAYEKADEE